MEVLADPAQVPGAGSGTAVTIGAYDGVHRGHQAVLAELRRLADERGLLTAVVTFDRHPAAVVRPESAPKLLTDLDQKLEVLAATGHVDYAVVLTFDERRAAQEAPAFVDELLGGLLQARLVVVGEDFHFGRGRRGTVDLLRTMGAALGFDVVGLPLIGVAGVEGPVSSTAVRRRLAGGDVAGAAALLGRPYELRGVVEPGDARGARLLGFPTANVAVAPEILLPADGIYAGWYERPGGQVHPAAISVGRRPTFYEGAPSSLVEAYLLDFDGDLYGEAARVRFVDRLRGEERFESVEALVAQMELDVDAARQVLAVPPTG
ncbi:MAG TPA: bifunctional riboflavin kinase/FAD synthetase [Acidimicrobiales bacterium]|nr:bifunctional riboflavin kinase/FAD synthetase [Acidimicrobiales bacterium]